MDHNIGWGKSHRSGIAQRHSRWQNKLIALPTRIRLSQGHLWAARIAIAVKDDALERGRGALPTGVAVHAVVATTDRRDLCRRRRLAHALLERGKGCRRRSGRRITAIEKQVHKNSRDTSLVSGAQYLDRMAVVGVHSATPKQRQQVEATLSCCSDCAAQAAHLFKRAVGNRRINTW